MNPIIAFKYHRKNQRKFLFLFLPILLGVVIIYILQMLITSQYQIIYRTYVEPQKYYSSIAARTKVIDQEILNDLFLHKSDYEKVMPWVSHYTYIDTVINNRVGSKVYTIKQEDMDWLIKKLNLRIKEGRLPKAGSNEIILHSVVAKNKKLRIGDSIGGSIQKNEALEGEKVIVGLLEGESVVSFDSLENWMNRNQVLSDDYSTGTIIIPLEEKKEDVNYFINHIDNQGLDIRTYDSVLLQNEIDRKGINTVLTLINIMLVVIVTICTGFISYINMLQRRSEFGILNAIGYSTNQLINRSFNEIFWLNMAGFLLGVLVSVFVGFLLNLFVYTPKGIPLMLVKTDYLIETACIPLFACIFALLSLWKIIKILDPVEVIEGMH